MIFKTEGHHDISRKKLIYAFLLTFGLAVFHFGDPHKNVETEIAGWFFAFLSLFCDCFVAHFQKKLQTTQKDISYFTILQATNFWCLIFSIVYSCMKAELVDGFSFFIVHPAALWDILANAFTASLMLYFLFYHLNAFGPVSTAKITVVRKVFTVFFSFLIFRHQLNNFRIAGLSIILMLIFIEMQEEIRKSTKEAKEKKD